MTGLADGVYAVSAYATGGGGQSAAYLSAKDYGAGVPELTTPVPMTGWPHWRRIVIPGVRVTGGALTLGIYSAGSGGQWLSVDAVTLTRQ